MSPEEVRSHLLSYIESKKNEQTQLLEDLVKIPSISCTQHEGAAQKLVERSLRGTHGIDLDLWEPRTEDLSAYPLHPIRTGEWTYDGRPNVVGILRGTGGGKSIILNGHIDVVSPEPVKEWKHAPWGSEIVGDKMYGRGTMDMKGGIAAMVYAVRAIAESGIKLRGDVILESMVEEEYGGGGTVAAVVKGYKADAAIICEATSSNSIGIASGGSRFFRVKIYGKPEWPHLAHYGVNAIGLASKVYEALLELDRERGLRLRGKHPMLESLRAGDMRGPGRPTNMTIGVMRAGDWPATVAGWAEIEGRVGFPPSESGHDVQREVEQAVRRAAEGDPWMLEHPPEVEWWGARREAFELDPSSPVVQTLKKNVDSLVGPCELYGTSSASDAAYIAPKVGAYGGIPTVSYGPGGGGAHTFDEYVNLQEVTDVTKVLASTIIDWCGRDDAL
ncbi:MAG: ArgE/DapE family deacylase [Thaumarchaeota archaeon]|nr:ArgE/DapE family deacylase [Nitrososphaerota archaeon]